MRHADRVAELTESLRLERAEVDRLTRELEKARAEALDLDKRRLRLRSEILRRSRSNVFATNLHMNAVERGEVV